MKVNTLVIFLKLQIKTKIKIIEINSIQSKRIINNRCNQKSMKRRRVIDIITN